MSRLRIPLLVSRFLPFSVLLGTLIAFVGLNQNSEVVAMKAAGLSAHQILAPLFVASIGIAAALFAFNETVVVKSTRVVTAWSDNDYKPVPPDSGILSNVWLLNGDDLVSAGLVIGRGAQPPRQRTRHLRPQRRHPPARDHAPPRGPASGAGDWLLQDVRIYDADMNVVRRLPTMAGARGRHAGPVDAGQGRPDRARLLDVEAADRRARGGRTSGRRSARRPRAQDFRPACRPC